MPTLVFDPFSGASGDMIISSLIDLGADRDTVVRAMASVAGMPEITEVRRAGLRGLQIRTNAGHSHRTFAEVEERVESADAPRTVTRRAMEVFQVIRDAEEVVHGGAAHFHEVGADDAVADVVGACMALKSLEPDCVATLPVTVGNGTVTGSHGTLPVPAPATLEVLKRSGLVIRPCTGEPGELLTPTGAALLAVFADRTLSSLPSGTITRTGYGAGKRALSGTPNLLRTVLIDRSSGLLDDQVDVLETNTDDTSGEVIAAALARIMASGARDASAIPCIMKKGRAGHLVRVITQPDASAGIAVVMARELGTLGVRCTPAVHRFIARRDTARVTIWICGEQHEVPVKFGYIGEECYNVKAEADEARRIADAAGVPVRTVMRLAEEEGWRRLKGPDGGT